MASRDWPKAVEVYKTLFNLFPDDLDYGLHLASAQMNCFGMMLVATIDVEAHGLRCREPADGLRLAIGNHVTHVTRQEGLRLRLGNVLPLRHQPELENFLQELYDPSSPSYRHFLTVQEFTARFGPSQEDYEAVVRFAEASGLKVVSGSRDAMDIQLKGSVGATDNAPNSPQTVSLSGTGTVQATLTPATAKYAKQKVGTTSLPKAFTLTNKQSVPLNDIAVATTGDFSISGTTCGTSLNPLGICVISVVFTPTATGTRLGSLSVSSDSISSPQTSTVTGTGK